jgi:hypothetical protein
MRTPILYILASIAALLPRAVHAESWDYPEASFHTQNSATYSFTATTDEDLTAYFMPSTGTYRSALGAKVDGVIVGRNQLAMGRTDNFTSYDFGHVSAGATIEFFIDVTRNDAAGTPMGTYYSTVADNADGLQHIWAAPHPDQWYLGPHGVPQGTFIGFEDTTTGDPLGDLNYRDYTFVVPGLTVAPAPQGQPGIGSPAAAVPEASTWAMLVVGFGAVGGSMRRRRRATAAVA